METYVPELDQAAANRTAASLSAATAELRARGAMIELLHSFALLGEEMCFSLFSAATLADVRTAGELAKVGYEQLAEVVSYRPDTPERDVSYDVSTSRGRSQETTRE